MNTALIGALALVGAALLALLGVWLGTRTTKTIAVAQRDQNFIDQVQEERTAAVADATQARDDARKARDEATGARDEVSKIWVEATRVRQDMATQLADLTRRLNRSETYVLVLVQHINDGKGPPAPIMPQH